MKEEAHPTCPSGRRESFPKGRTFNFASVKLGVRVMLLIFSLPLGGLGWAQSPTIKKSDKIETIEGKKFYIHSVEKGQTLYSIAKTYGTTVDIVLSNNQDAIDGLKAGDKLKIPFIGNTEAIKKEIEKKEITSAQTKTPLDTTQKRTAILDPKSFKEISVPVQKKDTSRFLSLRDSLTSDSLIVDENIQVALFLPLSLAMINNIDVWKIAQGDEKIPEETKIGIEFYEGMKMAFDSLKKTGFKGHLHVYDSNLDSTGFVKLMKKPELKEMDLLIGPLYGKRFETVLKFAKEYNINIVSPTLQGNNMLMGNPNVSKVTPSYATQADELAKYVAGNYAGQNIIVFNSANPKDKPYLNTFKKTANAILQKSNSDTVKEVTFSTLKNFISKTKPNIIVIPSTSQPFVIEAVNKLFLDEQENKDSIIVFGLSNFQDMESLDYGYLNALHTMVSSYNFVDYTHPQTKNFILKYRDEFKTEPTQYVFSGFDVGCFYLSGLKKYGSAMQRKLPELKHKGIQTEFSFFQSDFNSGYENKGVGIMKFENYTYTRVK
ncbi:MAG: ABC transporter substrate-binding protein [Bacteroidetes bacterium]|nr:ABC transporter substrate-binding protein [Bacteroidota bacterium]